MVEPDKKEEQFAHRKGAVTQETLRYPLDLESQPFYPESIKFTVYRRHGASLKQIKDKYPDAEIISGGGIRNMNTLELYNLEYFFI